LPLFLSGGRITRAIPEGGLENFDWTAIERRTVRFRDLADARGGLVVTWGTAESIRARSANIRSASPYGKRYAKPAAVSAATRRPTIVARTASPAAASSRNGVVIAADGRYQWVSTTGGVVEGRAVASDRAMSGR
jgi:hypothetical protein